VIQIGATAATIDSPIEHLTACHRRIEQRLETLIRAGGHIERDRPSALDAIAKSLQFMDTSGILHTEDEEASLFPRLRKKLSAGEIAFLDSLEAQHDQAESIYAELKETASELERSSAFFAESIARYRSCAERLHALYGAHIRMEDEVLTAMARRSLDESEIVQISREMRERRALRSAGLIRP
jgi:iron-sulfur cluster repair protein YtfE (RIC family)